MKIYTVLLLSLNITLFANPIITKLECINKQLYLKISTNQLHLTDEALVDNTGGYVDIPEEKYYLKTDTAVIKLEAKVVKDFTSNTNKFQTIIKNEDIKTLKTKKDFVLIQKIDLLKNNKQDTKQNITTTNKIIISVNNKAIKQLKTCQR